MSGKEIDASQAERLGRLSIACSVFSLARSAQAERDNESCFFVHEAGVHRFIRRQHVKRKESGWPSPESSLAEFAPSVAYMASDTAPKDRLIEEAGYPGRVSREGGILRSQLATRLDA
ncbi:hypothetical protein EVAR_43804_1 [Eumeta japonica]|uniref:Uncharacterized protein n=1 Tax=Eumeta variegata TaxID=151549 RepID=A0A4C1XW22_EUMVA|nr:hypothetical protein EVAR_43804_1 [Eumeta japonica]